MNEFEHFWKIWLLRLMQAQLLALRYSELGINPDKLYLEPPESLSGILRLLQNYHDKVSSDGEE